MKHQVLFSKKDKSKKIKCRLLQLLLGALRVKLRLHGETFIYFNRCQSRSIFWESDKTAIHA